MSGRRIPRLKPILDLAEIQRRLVEGEDFRVAGARAIDDTTEALQCTAIEARRFAQDFLLSLAAGDYTGMSVQYGERICDEYAKVIDGRGWYLKFSIGEGGIVINSCHPTLEPVKTVGGNQVPRGRK